MSPHNIDSPILRETRVIGLCAVLPRSISSSILAFYCSDRFIGNQFQHVTLVARCSTLLWQYSTWFGVQWSRRFSTPQVSPRDIYNSDCPSWLEVKKTDDIWEIYRDKVFLLIRCKTRRSPQSLRPPGPNTASSKGVKPSRVDSTIRVFVAIEKATFPQSLNNCWPTFPRKYISCAA